MRVLVDANVFVSFLLSRKGASTPPIRLVRWLLADNAQLIVPDDLILELEAVVLRAHLRSAIDHGALDSLLGVLRDLAVETDNDEREADFGMRDTNDWYLLRELIAGRADVLVTGDRDLLALADAVTGVRILSPAQFVSTFLDDAERD